MKLQWVLFDANRQKIAVSSFAVRTRPENRSERAWRQTRVMEHDAVVEARQRDSPHYRPYVEYHTTV